MPFLPDRSSAANSGALVLTPSSLDVATAEEVFRNDPEHVIVAGSEAVVPAAVLMAVRALFDSADGVTAAATGRTSEDREHTSS